MSKVLRDENGNFYVAGINGHWHLHQVNKIYYQLIHNNIDTGKKHFNGDLFLRSGVCDTNAQDNLIEDAKNEIIGNINYYKRNGKWAYQWNR